MSFFTGIGRILGIVGKWSGVGLNFIPYIGQAMTLVEMISSLKGSAKRKQAVDTVKLLVATTEGIAGKDLVNDAEVVKAMEALMDAQVAFQNIVAKKSAAS